MIERSGTRALCLELWGKRASESQAYPSHPLLFHMMDVAAVADGFWRTVLGRTMRKFLSRRLGMDEDSAGQWIAFLAGLHDIGKASPLFQGTWEEAKRRLVDHGLEFRPSTYRSPRGLRSHGMVTALALQKLLPELGMDVGLADGLGRALGGHHGVFPIDSDLQDLEDREEATGTGLWSRLRAELFEELVIKYCVRQLPMILKEPGHPFLLLFAGIVAVADWIGSNDDVFPYAERIFDPDNYAMKAQCRAQKALEILGWSAWPAPGEHKSITGLFPSIPPDGLYPTQRAIEELSNEMSEPALIIVEAPMGEGKTEAALYLADHWAVTLEQRGCYFALPTQATSNQIFGRVLKFLASRYPQQRVNVQLLHGLASLSAEFEVLRFRADILFRPSRLGSEAAPRQDRWDGDVMAAEWFTHRKRGLLAPFGVGTVDQVLLSVLQTKHFFVRLFGLAGKTVIVDEVHAYDAYMSVLLERLLEWLASIDCSVVLLSATLPSQRRQDLIAAFARGRGIDSRPSTSHDVPYPRITWVASSSTGCRHVEASHRFTRKIALDWMTSVVPDDTDAPFELGERLQERLLEGGCAAVICNTVGRAQQIYRALKGYFPCGNAGDGWPELDLLHARYLFKDRQEREMRALVRFGKPGGEVPVPGWHGETRNVNRPFRAVLVATQIIEQSLDLDFDLIVTDMAPIDLILQRAGRLHRHDRPQRPASLISPNLWMLAPEIREGVPHFGEGSEHIYDRHVLLRSWLAVRDRLCIGVPGNVDPLIEDVYREADSPTHLAEALRLAWDEGRRESHRKRHENEQSARGLRILPPFYPDDLLAYRKNVLEEDDPDIHRSLQALTRLSDPTVSVVCLYGTEDAATLESGGRGTIDLRAEPDRDLTRSLLERSVTLSHKGLVHWLLDQGLTPSGWSRCALLRYHRVIFLDAANQATMGKLTLNVHDEEGIIIKGGEKRHETQLQSGG